MKKHTEQDGRLEEVLEDFRNLYHDHFKTLQNITLLLRPTFEYLKPNPFPSQGMPSAEALSSAFARPLDALESALGRLRAELSSRPEEQGISPSQLYNLDQRISQIKRLRAELAPTLLASSIRQNLGHLDVWFNNVRATGGRTPADRVDEVIASMKEISRLCCLYSLHLAIDRVVSMDERAHAIRRRVESLTCDGRAPEERTASTLPEMFGQAVSQLGDYARSRRVTILPPELEQGHDAPVEVNLQDVVQALACIIHNAIKYSHQLQQEEAWINVRMGREDQLVVAWIESWGTPITVEEIEQEFIFRRNYRGIYALNAGRHGTGSGLSYAREVARRHGGDVTATSRPPKGGRPENYNQTFITTIRFALKARPERKV
jgi:signal transduction histidine kinase